MLENRKISVTGIDSMAAYYGNETDPKLMTVTVGKVKKAEDYKNCYSPLDITKEFISEKFVNAEGALNIDLKVLCDNKIVSYKYSGKAMTEESFVKMICSAPFFGTLPEKPEVIRWTPGEENVPDFFQAHSSPSEEALKYLAPYSYLLPGKLPGGFGLSETYVRNREIGDVADTVAFKDYGVFTYSGSNKEDALTVTVSRSSETDKAKGTIPNNEVSEKKIKEQMASFGTSGPFEISVSFGDYVIEYSYKAAPIPAGDVYRMIKSALIFN